MTPIHHLLVQGFRTRTAIRAATVATVVLSLSACASMDTSDFASTDSGVAPHSLEHQDIDTAFAQGLRYLNEGNAAAAEQSFSRVLKVKPKNAKASLGLAESYLTLGRFDEALTIFRELSRQPQHEAVAMQGQGLALYLKGHRTLAKDRLDAAVAADPSLWRAWSVLGQYWDSEKNWVEAEKAYLTALTQNPDAASIYNNFGMSLLTQNRAEHALVRFEEALMVEQNMTAAKANRQIALSILGRYTEALENVSAEEKHVALNNIGYIAMTRGDLKVAMQLFNQSADSSPTYYPTAEGNLDRAAQILSQKNSAR